MPKNDERELKPSGKKERFIPDEKGPDRLYGLRIKTNRFNRAIKRSKENNKCHQISYKIGTFNSIKNIYV